MCLVIFFDTMLHQAAQCTNVALGTVHVGPTLFLGQVGISVAKDVSGSNQSRILLYQIRKDWLLLLTQDLNLQGSNS